VVEQWNNASDPVLHYSTTPICLLSLVAI